MATTFGKYIIEFLPIILIYLLVTYTNLVVRMSHTILGKIFAVCLIIFYSTIDEIHGAVVCILVIYYYQSDYVEGMATLLNQEEVPPFSNKPVFSNKEGYKDDSDSDSDLDSDSDDEEKKKKRKRRKKRRSKKDEDEGFELLKDAYIEKPTPKEPSLSEESKRHFQKRHCKNGHLIFEDHRVKTEMTEHVFPEIKYNDERCNLCDPTCDYSIVESKIVTEETLRPKESNDWVDHVWKTMTEYYSS